MADIICAGFGGQGVLTAGLILAKISMDDGKNVTWIPSYGSEMRGGTANCTVKINDEEISSPFARYIDILVAMNEPSVSKFENMLRPGGILIVNQSIVKDYPYRQDIKVVEVDATEIADNLENSRGANIVMIGAFGAATTLLDKDVLAQGVDNFFQAKGKNNPKNRLCFDQGYQAAVASLAKA